MSTVVLPKLTMTVASIVHADQLETTVSFEGLGEPHVCSATAAMNPSREASLRIALELSVVRALHQLEHEIMERIHEGIDRVTDDI